VRISEIDLAEALISDHSKIKTLVNKWEKRNNQKGFNPYGQVIRYVLKGDLNRDQRPQILSRVSSYKERMQPERNRLLIERTWDLFDSTGGEVIGAEPYSVTWPNLKIKISAGYLYHSVINWFRKKAPTERLIRSVLEVLQLTKPAGWPSTRVPALLIVEAQDMRIAGPVAPAHKKQFQQMVELIGSIAS